MSASTIELNDLRKFMAAEQDPLWDHTKNSWLIALAVCVVQAVVLVILLAIQLKRLDPHRQAGK
jgi:hypothetical protein